jgi:glycosyltransferase involved in cell wall biosynthesis
VPAPRTEPPDLELILACYNEGEHFTESVREILSVMDAQRWRYGLIFVDDCSKDDTRALIDRCIAEHPNHRMRRIFHEKNTGRGGAVSDGFRAATAPIVGYFDIDLEAHARYVASCVRAIEGGADVAVAWRFYKLSLRSLNRHVLSRGYHWLLKQILHMPLNDTESGFKFFRRERLLPLLDRVEDKGWFWDTEVMVRALQAGYRIVEVPVLFVRRTDKTSTVNAVRDSVEYFQRLIELRRKLTAAHEELPSNPPEPPQSF